MNHKKHKGYKEKIGNEFLEIMIFAFLGLSLLS